MAGFANTVTKELLLLGLLKRKPMYGYELKQLIDEELSNIAPISSGSLYHNLKTLEKKGLVTKTVVKDSAHPEKQIFEITGEGTERFDRLAGANVTNFDRPNLALDVSLYFLEETDAAQLLARMEELLEKLRAHHDDAERFKDELTRKGAPYNIVSIPKHYLAHSSAEIGFLEDFITNMKESEAPGR